jgi:RNA polymerase sigma-70 factor (ECF subfamily)
VPENPSAWLITTAKHLALDTLRRQRTATTFAPELAQLLQSESTLAPVVEEMFAANEIKDDLLRMMFSCCLPRLPEESQVALILHILCGFSVAEIASAFVSSETSIEKRITRGKKVLGKSKKLFDIATPAEFSTRLPAVQRALYLLFNEGYHGASADAAVHVGLCKEAMRLVAILLEHPSGKTPSTYALAALMSFDAARLPARVDASGNLRSLSDQDRSQWDQELMSEALKLLYLSTTDTQLTQYHVEAAIASIHARANRVEETDWTAIVGLYDTLMAIQPSPIVALNRAIAVAQRDGPERGLEEIRAISDIDRLIAYPFYSAALGEMELRRGRFSIAREHYQTALRLARNPMEHRFLEQRIEACNRGETQDALAHVIESGQVIHIAD